VSYERKSSNIYSDLKSQKSFSAKTFNKINVLANYDSETEHTGSAKVILRE